MGRSSPYTDIMLAQYWMYSEVGLVLSILVSVEARPESQVMVFIFVVCGVLLFVCFFPQILRNGWERQFLCFCAAQPFSSCMTDREGLCQLGKPKYVETQPPAPSLEQHMRSTASPRQTCRYQDGVGGGRVVGMRENISSSWMGVVGAGHANRHHQPAKGRALGLAPVSYCPPSLSNSPGSAAAPKQVAEGRWLSCSPSTWRPFQPGRLALLLPF